MADTITRVPGPSWLETGEAVGLRDVLAARAAETQTCLDALLAPLAGREARLIDAMRYATLNGGKRMRAFLVVEVASLFEVPMHRALRVAASVEMLHAYSLVHDDLPAMDDDDLRRGQPSCHRKFDEATAILAGDALQCRAFEVLADPATHPDAEARIELVSALASAAGAGGRGGGPTRDIEAARAHRGDTASCAQDRAADPVRRRGGRDPRSCDVPGPAGDRGLRARSRFGLPGGRRRARRDGERR